MPQQDRKKNGRQKNEGMEANQKNETKTRTESGNILYHQQMKAFILYTSCMNLQSIS